MMSLGLSAQSTYGTDGTWGTSGNWSAGIPDSTDAVTINNNRTCTINVTGYATTISLNNGSSLIANTTPVTVYLYGTNMSGNASIVSAANSATVSLDSVALYIMKTGAQMNEDLAVKKMFIKGTNFTVKAGNLVVHDSMVISGTGCSFQNNSDITVGTLVVSGSGVSFQPQGSLTVLNNLTIQGGATVSSQGTSPKIQYSADATLVLETGSMDATTFDEIWPATGGPTNVQINLSEGDTFVMPESRTVEGSLTLSGGTVTGGSNFVLGDSAEIVVEEGTIDSLPPIPNKINIYYNSSVDTTKYTGTEVPTDSSKIGNIIINTVGKVRLSKRLFLADTLKLKKGYIELEDYDVRMGDNSIITGGSQSAYIRITGNGRLRRKASASGTLFPIGYNPYVPVTIFSAGTEEFAVGVDSGVITSDGSTYFTKNAVNRTWSISTSSTVSNASVTLQWSNAYDSLDGFDFSNCAVAYTYGGTNDWIRTQAKASASGSDPYQKTFSFDFLADTTYYFYIYSDTNETDYISANLKVLLEGPYSTNTGTMSTALRAGSSLGSENLLPSAQPYSTAPWNYGGTENVDTASHPTNSVDWVLVELRSTYNGAAVANGQAAGFLLADGSIVDTNGVSAIRFWNLAPDYYYVVIKHRNHLPVMSADSIYISSVSALYDFTTGQSKAYGADTTGIYAMPMSVLSNGYYAMRAGDIGGSASYQIRYNGGGVNDRVSLLSYVGGNSNSGTPINNEYSRLDLNLNRQIRYNGGGLNDRVLLLNIVGGNSQSGQPITCPVPNP